jgi:hypothetical protein
MQAYSRVCLCARACVHARSCLNLFTTLSKCLRLHRYNVTRLIFLVSSNLQSVTIAVLRNSMQGPIFSCVYMILMSMVWHCISELRIPTGLLLIPQTTYVNMNILSGQNRRTWRKICPSVILFTRNELTRERTRTSAMRGRRLTVLTTAWPCVWTAVHSCLK